MDTDYLNKLSASVNITDKTQTNRFFRVTVCGLNSAEVREYIGMVADAASYLTYHNCGNDSLAELIAVTTGLFDSDSLGYLEHCNQAIRLERPSNFSLRYDNLNTSIFLDSGLYFDNKCALQPIELVKYLTASSATIVLGHVSDSVDCLNDFMKLSWTSKIAITNYSPIVKTVQVDFKDIKDFLKKPEHNYITKCMYILKPITEITVNLNDMNPCNTPEHIISSLIDNDERLKYAASKIRTISSTGCGGGDVNLGKYVNNILIEAAK